MKRLLVALMIVVMTSATALAHGHGGFRFGVSLGIPLFYPYYSYPYYSYPAYGYPAYSYPVYNDSRYESPPAYDGQHTRTVIEKYYVNGQLVERRVRVYDDHGYELYRGNDR